MNGPVTQRSPDVPPGLTSQNSAGCPHSVFMCFVWIWEQTAIIYLYKINWLVFITKKQCVYCAVRTEYLYTIQVILVFKSPLWVYCYTVKYHSKVDKFFVRYWNIEINEDSCQQRDEGSFKNFVTSKNETHLFVTLNLPIYFREICNGVGRWIKKGQDRVQWRVVVLTGHIFLYKIFLKNSAEF